MIYKVSGVKTLNETYHSLVGRAAMGLDYALRRRGPLTMAPSQLGLFTRSDPSRERANIQFHVQPLSLDKFGDPLHTYPAFTTSVCNLQPQSRGHVRLRSADPADKPVIAPHYLSAEEDRRVAANSIRVARAIVAQPALQKFKPVETLPGEQVKQRRRGRARQGRGRHRHDDLPSRRHREDGPDQRSERRGRRAAARARHRGPARDRRLGDADHHVRQHQLADHDDRREGRADGAGRSKPLIARFAPVTARRAAEQCRLEPWRGAMDLVARAKGLLLDPKAEWRDHRAASRTTPRAIAEELCRDPCRHSGGVRIYRRLDHRRLGRIRTPFSSGLVGAIIGYLLTLHRRVHRGVRDRCAGRHSAARKNFTSAMKVAAFAPTAAWLASAVHRDPDPSRCSRCSASTRSICSTSAFRS